MSQCLVCLRPNALVAYNTEPSDTNRVLRPQRPHVTLPLPCTGPVSPSSSVYCHLDIPSPRFHQYGTRCRADFQLYIRNSSRPVNVNIFQDTSGRKHKYAIYTETKFPIPNKDKKEAAAAAEYEIRGSRVSRGLCVGASLETIPSMEEHAAGTVGREYEPRGGGFTVDLGEFERLEATVTDGLSGRYIAIGVSAGAEGQKVIKLFEIEH